MALVSENNIPNAKVISGFVISAVSIGIVWYASSKGIVIPEDSVNKELLSIMAGIASVRTLIEYLFPPRKGDGVKEKV